MVFIQGFEGFGVFAKGLFSFFELRAPETLNQKPSTLSKPFALFGVSGSWGLGLGDLGLPACSLRLQCLGPRKSKPGKPETLKQAKNKHPLPLKADKAFQNLHKIVKRTLGSLLRAFKLALDSLFQKPYKA